MPSQHTQPDAPRHSARTWGLIALGALTACFACTGPSAPKATSPTKSVAVTEPSKTENTSKSNAQTAIHSNVPWLLSQLREPEVKAREKALDEVEAMAGTVGLSPDEVTLVLAA